MEQRTIVFGDIHACADEFFELLDACSPRSDDLIVSTGDLIDRGPDPSRILDFFMEGGSRLAVAGNHERKHVRGILSFSQQVTREMLGERYESARTFLTKLPLFLDLPDALVVHAAYIPGTPMERQSAAVLAGHSSGTMELQRHFPNGRWWEAHSMEKPVVFGHSVMERVDLVRGRVYGLDGSCAKGGWLHALILPEHRIVSVKSRGNHWDRIRREYEIRFREACKKGGFNPDSLDRLSWSALAKLSSDLSVQGRTRREILALIRKGEAMAGPLANECRVLSETLLTGMCREEAFTRVKNHPLRALLMEARFGEIDAEIVIRKSGNPLRLKSLFESSGLPIPDP